jgi:hypothetical protein
LDFALWCRIHPLLSPSLLPIEFRILLRHAVLGEELVLTAQKGVFPVTILCGTQSMPLISNEISIFCLDSFR